MELPEARVGRRYNLRPLGYAALIAAAAWFCGPAVTLVVVGVGGFLAVTSWILYRWLVAEEAEATVRESPPEGERVYPLRPRWTVTVLLIGAVLGTAGAFVAAAWFAGLLFGGAAVALAIPYMTADVLRQRIVVTDLTLELPVSQWSSEVVTVPLSSVRVRVEDQLVQIEAWPLQRTFSKAWVGGGGAVELGEVLKVRSARCKSA